MSPPPMKHPIMVFGLIEISFSSFVTYMMWSRYKRRKTRQSLILLLVGIGITLFDTLAFYKEIVYKYRLPIMIFPSLILLIMSFRIINRREIELNWWVENTPDAIFRVELGRGITRVNPRFHDILGYSLEEVEELGPNFTELVHFEDRDKFLEDMKALTTLQKTRSTGIYRFNTKGGEEI